MDKERIAWIDVAKCVGMLLVIFNHFSVNYGQSNIKVVIASFHMPLFFVLSGFTMKNEPMTSKEYYQYLAKRFCRVMIPYFLWAFIFCSGITLKNIFGIIWASNKSLSIANSNAALWFLPCIFVSSAMVRLILVKKNSYFLACSVALNFALGGGVE